MATWPITLQQKVNESGYSKQFGSTKIRSENGVGPAKVRRRYTKRIDSNNITMNLSRDEYDTFNNFYDVTLNGGVEQFTFTDPITDTEKSYRFVGDPNINPIGGNEFVLQMVWEELP